MPLDIAPSDPQLRRWYCRFNAEWFGGELPDVAVYWEPIAAHGDTILIEKSGDGGAPELAIRINPACRTIHSGGRQSWAKLTLGHEMVHVKLWHCRGLTDHGRMFDKEIQRLCGIKSFRRLI